MPCTQAGLLFPKDWETNSPENRRNSCCSAGGPGFINHHVGPTPGSISNVSCPMSHARSVLLFQVDLGV